MLLDCLIFTGVVWASTAVVMAGVWLVQRRTGDATVVDVAWAYGIGITAAVAIAVGDGDLYRRLLVGGLGAVWSLRLGTHLLIDRVIRADEEDGRYRMLREQAGDQAQRFMFWFFQAQALFVVIFSLPFLTLVWDPRPLDPLWAGLGAAIWLTAVIGEGIADRQLARWRADPANRGRTCRAGLWRYSRHPNYFFEWLHWLTYPVIGIGFLGSIAAWVVPAVLLFLIFRVTGIPYTERQALASRGEDYRRYQRTTSPFFPWFPRHEESSS